MSQSKKTFIFRIMFALNIIGAGVPGFLIVFFPSFAEQYVLWEGQDHGVMTVLGSIWLAIGLVSCIGMMQPYKFLGVFVIQFFYKTIWLITYVVPAFLAQEELPSASYFLIGIFLLLILEFLLFIRLDDFNQLIVKTSTDDRTTLSAQTNPPYELSPQKYN